MVYIDFGSFGNNQHTIQQIQKQILDEAKSDSSLTHIAREIQNNGGADGILGPKTKQAIKDYLSIKSPNNGLDYFDIDHNMSIDFKELQLRGLFTETNIDSLSLKEEIHQFVNNLFAGVDSNTSQLILQGKGIENKHMPLIIDRIKGMPSITHLNFSNNSLLSIPESLCELTQLQELNLGSNNLINIPHSINNLANLEKLEIYDNNLTNIPETFYELKALKYLNVANNDLENISKSICQLETLEILDLASNNLISIPREIRQLKNLKRLDLASNNLMNIPDSIGNLDNLALLLLNDNNLTSLPKSLSWLKSLEILDVADNNLIHIPDLSSKAKIISRGNYSKDGMPKVYSIHLDSGRGEPGTHSHQVEQALRSSELDIIDSYHIRKGDYSKAINRVNQIRNGQMYNIPKDSVIAITTSYIHSETRKGKAINKESICNGLRGMLKQNNTLTPSNVKDIETFRKSGSISPDLKELILDHIKEIDPELHNELMDLKKLASMDNVFITSPAGNDPSEFDIKSLIDGIITVTDPDKGKYASSDSVDAELSAKFHYKSELIEGTSFASPSYLGEYISSKFRPEHDRLEYEQNYSTLAKAMSISEKQFRSKYPQNQYKIADIDSNSGRIINLIDKDTQDVVYIYGINNNGEEFTESIIDWETNWLIDFKGSVRNNQGKIPNSQFFKNIVRNNPKLTLDHLGDLIQNLNLQTSEEILEVLEGVDSLLLQYPKKWVHTPNLSAQCKKEIIKSCFQKYPSLISHGKQWIPVSGLMRDELHQVLLPHLENNPLNLLWPSSNWITATGLTGNQIKSALIEAIQNDKENAGGIILSAKNWIPDSNLNKNDVKEIINLARNKDPKTYSKHQDSIQSEINKLI